MAHIVIWGFDYLTWLMYLTMEPNSVTSQTDMNLAGLPSDTKLFQLISTCVQDHEIELRTCADGAMIFECMECPFKRVLDDREEEYMRQQEELIIER